MPTFLSELLTQVRNIWAQLSGGQRATMAAVVAATLVGIAGLVFYATRPDYVAFANGAAAEDRTAVLAALDEKNIDYRMENGLILVNGSQKSDAEKALDSKGLRGMSGGRDEASSITQGRDQRRWQLQQKQLRKVEAQLRKIKGVRSALVNVYDPAGPNLLRAREPRRASVVLDLVRADTFAEMSKIARGIVANSLGLKIDDVQVTDTNMQTLDGPAGTGGGSFSPHLSLQRQHSDILTMRARQMLERVWPGKTHVSVMAEYDNKVTESEEKIVSPEKVVTDTKSYKTKDSTGAAATGDPNSVGTTRNDSAAKGGGPEQNSSVTQTHTTFDPIIGRRIQKPLAPDLKRLSISLSIDESLQAKKSEIETQVKNSVGWIENRDSAVSAMVVKFEELDVTPAAGSTMDLVKEWAPLAGQILSVLLVIFFLRGLLKSNKKVIRAEAAKATADAKAASEAPESPVEQSMRLRKEIEKAVADDPASVSRLLESWLANKEPA